jgi:hypothetical protein
VLSTIARRITLRAADPEPERVVRRAITLTPSRGAEVIANPSTKHQAPSTKPRDEVAA